MRRLVAGRRKQKHHVPQKTDGECVRAQVRDHRAVAESSAGRWTWLRGLDSNQDSQIQSLECCRLHHPGAVLLSVADHPTLAQASAFAAIRNPNLVRADSRALRLSSIPALDTQSPPRTR